ncbi:MAG: hypothetical protein ACFFG0_08250 [Candidatus Thorarchaeota archaeon]
MRIPEYLSPTSIHIWQDDEELFYQRYLSEFRLPREPQTQPQSIGSAFDAYVKCYIYKCVFGKEEEPYILKNLFENQVEEHNRNWAWEHGKLVFDQYKKAGCIADIMLELEKAVGPPNFEFEIRDTIQGIPLLGKPDIFFISDKGFRVIYDWKVNGYCSSNLKSPMKGYLKLREKGKLEKSHKNCVPALHGGITINADMFLEEGDKSWADQESVYAWLLGENIGSENWVSGIDQICGPASRLRFATHRCRVSSTWQQGFFDVAKELWDRINSGWFFRHLSEEDSKNLCNLLDEVNKEELDGGYAAV